MNQEKVMLSIPSILGYEEVVVETVGAVARVRRFPFEKISKLQTAVAEACINAIEHGNKENPEKDVVVTINCEESSISVSIKDFGEEPFQPDFEMPDIRKQVEERRLGGWGMYLMRTLVDKVTVDTEPGDGTTTTMIIYP